MILNACWLTYNLSLSVESEALNILHVQYIYN